MPDSHATLDAAAQERKARLAKLKSLKRKQPANDDEADAGAPGKPAGSTPQEDEPMVTDAYLSGRNFDAETRGPKLGFEHNPAAGHDTLELRAKGIADTAKADETAARAAADEPIDLFKLQPKKPNWDLKRDLDRKLERLNVQTDNAIARIVRERIAAQKKAQEERANGDEEGEAVGLEGEELVKGVRQREQEEAEEERRERELEQDDEV